MIVGRVQQIWRYAVKSMAGEQLDECLVETLGIPGDRGWALRDETMGEITNGKRIPLLMQCAASYRQAGRSIPAVDITLPDGAVTASDDPNVNDVLTKALGKSVSLWPLQPASNTAHYRRAGASARIAGRLSRNRRFR